MKTTLDKVLSPGAILAAIAVLTAYAQAGPGVAALVGLAGLVVVGMSPRLTSWAYYLAVAVVLFWLITHYGGLMQSGW